jgi:adenylate kinase family enzyme
MIDYGNGKIYKIWHEATDMVYYGSTALELSIRMSIHRAMYKRFNPDEPPSKYNQQCSSYVLFDMFGPFECKMDLVENYPCNSDVELRMREQFHLDKNVCINKNKAYESPEQKKERHRRRSAEYYKHNRELKLKSVNDRVRQNKLISQFLEMLASI